MFPPPHPLPTMTDAPPILPPTAPPDTRVKLADLDRSTVSVWMQRERQSTGQWAEIATPEDRTSRYYKVIALLQDGSWVRVDFPRGGARPGSGGGGGARPGAGRPPGVKNSKPRSDKGKKRISH
jgi:hypothetical protein